MAPVATKPRRRVTVLRVEHGAQRTVQDHVVTEEPLQLRIAVGDERIPLATTMRTPGNDFELAAGFLHAEGLIHSVDDLRSIRYCDRVPSDERFNVVDVTLRSGERPDLERLERHFTINSACGVCGKAHLDAIHAALPDSAQASASHATPSPRVHATTLERLAYEVRSQQPLFDATGGLHAAGLFRLDGDAIVVREDVGRHNALDKAIGWALLQRIALQDAIVCVSGRASFELLQKTVAAGARIFAAVSAPSSLAIDVARRFDVTLIGFLRPGRMNVYSAGHRIDHASSPERAG